MLLTATFTPAQQQRVQTERTTKTLGVLLEIRWGPFLPLLGALNHVACGLSRHNEALYRMCVIVPEYCQKKPKQHIVSNWRR